MKKELNIRIPETINDLTVGEYQRYALIKEPTYEDILEIFYNIPKDLIQFLPSDKVEELATLIERLLLSEPTMVQQFTIGKTTFGFIPNLEKITYGENKDLTSYFGKMENMNRAMAVMYRPIEKEHKGSYSIEEYNGSHTYAEIMKVAPLGAMFGAMVFFWNLINELLVATQNYIVKMMKKKKKDLSSTQLSFLESSGEAMEKFMNSHKEISEGMNQSLNYRYSNV